MVGALGLSLAGTGCATKKYVTKSITPVTERVSAVENKNSEQDGKLATNEKEITDIGADLTRSKERLTSQIADVDGKATAAGQAAQQAGQRADGAQRSADGARTLAQQGNDKADSVKKDVDHAVRTFDGMMRYQMLKTETVLFAVNQSKLTAEGKAQLDDIAKSATGQDRFMIEVQGFTDKTGSPQINEQLSQARAVEVTRYLVNEQKVPVRWISSIGSGYAAPVGDDKTRDGRAMNRRVEVRVFVPEVASASQALASR
jgi:outer membrane protein OmpA-like peptidoglycan-associated protein